MKHTSNSVHYSSGSIVGAWGSNVPVSLDPKELNRTFPPDVPGTLPFRLSLLLLKHKKLADNINLGSPLGLGLVSF